MEQKKLSNLSKFEEWKNKNREKKNELEQENIRKSNIEKLRSEEEVQIFRRHFDILSKAAK